MSFTELVQIDTLMLTGQCELGELGQQGDRERGAARWKSAHKRAIDFRRWKEKYRSPWGLDCVRSGKRKWLKEPSAAKCPGQSV